MKELLLNNSNAIRTSCLPEVKSLLANTVVDYDRVSLPSLSIVEWLSPVVDLSEFHVYPTNGITEGLNWWMAHEQRSITIDQGDYQWVTPTIRGKDRIHYQSVPSAADGNFVQIRTDVAVAVDLAYIGSTGLQHIQIPKNVEFVFYSLSKSFGIRNVRTGWIFTRHEDPRLRSLTYDAKYYNYFANDIAEVILHNYAIDYVYHRVRSEQERVCNIIGATPSDSVWLATTTSDEYAKFRRRENIARLSLSGLYKL
jgi:hypothetical protein